MSTRKSRIAVCGLVAAVFLFSSLALAKADPNAPYRKGRRAAPGERMQQELGLTDEQVTQMEQLRTAHQEKIKAVRQAKQEKRKALNEAVESGAGEEAIRAAAAQLGAAMGDAAVLRAGHIAEVKKVLTAEQFEKWQELKQERHERRGMRGPGRKGRGAWDKGCGRGREGRKGRWGLHGRRGRMGPPEPEKVFAYKDSDGDGKLTLEEYTSSRRASAEHFAKADTDGDGAVTLEEFTESMKQFMGRHRGPR